MTITTARVARLRTSYGNLHAPVRKKSQCLPVSCTFVPMMLTPRQISLVRNGWKLLGGVDPELLGDVFYSKLFLDAPQTRSMFYSSRAVQSRKLFDMIHLIVTRLESPDRIADDLRMLGARHVHYGVKPHHYAAVGNALLWTLEQGLGKDWNAEVSEAWTECYRMVAGAMNDG